MMMVKSPGYPVPELIAYLEAMQDAAQNEENEFRVLAQLLLRCYAITEHANALWRSGRFTCEEPETLACKATHYGFRRLVPLLIESMAGGWREMLAYIEHPEQYPWYNPNTDWPAAPPLKEFQPAEDEEESVAARLAVGAAAVGAR
ncbi:MAG TPA: hypothetical protein VF458_19495 [Ktedonobacteraceae bacterium]